MNRWQQTRYVLGSDAVVTLVAADELAADDLFTEIWQRIDKFDQRFSRFKSDSELTRFNNAAGKSVTISPAFRELLVASEKMSEQTDGLYNPFVLPELQRAGYEGSWPNTEQSDACMDYKNRTMVSASALEISGDTARIPAESAFDSGGIGKGYLLDELGAVLDRQKLAGYWLSLGGDILCSGQDVDGKAWRIGIQHALQTDEVVAHVGNERGGKLGIATSGVTKRKGVKDGKPWHHLIDPRTGQPAETDVLTATVTADSATEADVYAKCLVLLGSKNAKAFVESHHIPHAVLQVSETNHSLKRSSSIEMLELGVNS